MANLTTALGLYFFTCGLASVAGPIIVGADNIILIFDLVRFMRAFDPEIIGMDIEIRTC